MQKCTNWWKLTWACFSSDYSFHDFHEFLWNFSIFSYIFSCFIHDFDICSLFHHDYLSLAIYSTVLPHYTSHHKKQVSLWGQTGLCIKLLKIRLSQQKPLISNFNTMTQRITAWEGHYGTLRGPPIMAWAEQNRALLKWPMSFSSICALLHRKQKI